MNTTKLSSKGQIIIPKWLRENYNWQTGLEFKVIDTGDGILLKPAKPFPETTIADVAGCLKYEGRPITLEDMERAIETGVVESWND